MITSEQLTEIINACKHMLAPELESFKNIVANIEESAGLAISKLEYDIKQLLVHQTALKDKLHYLQQRVDDPNAEPDQYDAIGEHRADKILNQPVMERQETVKTWEILEFKNYTRMSDGRFAMSEETEYQRFTTEMLIRFGAHIQSVRRLSDGEVFTIGDPINYREGLPGSRTSSYYNVTEFSIHDNEIYLNQHWKGSAARRISDWIKVELYTTADGVKVTHGSPVFYWHSERVTILECTAESGLNWTSHYSTLEAAKMARDKWLFDQRVLCLNDLAGDWFPVEYMDNMKTIVSQRLPKS